MVKHLSARPGCEFVVGAMTQKVALVPRKQIAFVAFMLPLRKKATTMKPVISRGKGDIRCDFFDCADMIDWHTRSPSAIANMLAEMRHKMACPEH
jgi:hypothetical protein